MKIMILSLLLTIQGQYIDDDQLSTSDTSTNNLFTLITEIKSSNENLFNQFNESTTIFNEISDRYENETWSSIKNDFDSSTIENQISVQRDKWFNVNQSKKKGDSFNSSIFWKKVNDNSLSDSTYILRSENKCLREMCRIKLKYNGSLSNKIDGCLSFILWTRGQPVGQLWIEEDEEKESFSQKIQLTNSSLRVEHSLKSKMKKLSIDARILFRNAKTDLITLSNLKINWKGSCPKHNSKITSFTNINLYQSTLELTTEDYYQTNTFQTDQTFQSSENNFLIELSTSKLDQQIKSKASSSFLSQSNIRWTFSLIILFCLLIIFSSFIYGLWSIQGHYRFIWYVPFDSPIQFLARRSIRSSTRSNHPIATLQQLTSHLVQIDFQQEDLDTFTTNSSRSTPSQFSAYF